MRTTGILTWVLLAVASTCMILCGIGGFTVYRGIEQGVVAMKPILVCTTEATALRDALLEVAKANGGQLPSSDNWKESATDTFRAARERLVAADSKLPRLDDPTGGWSDLDGVWGCRVPSQPLHAFAFNLDLAGKMVAEIKDPEKTVLVFESSEVVNKALPYKLRIDRTEPRVLGELRNWITVPVTGDVKDLLDPGSGSPASR